MSSLLDIDGNVGIDMDTVRADSDDMLNGNGNATNAYNEAAANSTTYLKTNLGRVDQADVSVEVQDGSLSTSAVGVQVVEARPAEEADFVDADSAVEGAIFFRISDEDGSGEIADDTDISVNDLTFSYTAVRE